MSSDHGINRSFGSDVVSSQERRSRIRSVFDAVARRYDLMNDLMSMGIHRIWKRRLARQVASVTGCIVDLAGGTGDVARLLVRSDRQVWVCDPSLAMMNAGRGHVGASAIHWVAGEAEHLPFADASVDLLTVSFGLRNATHLEAALVESCRVLRPNGVFVCLEFSRPSWWLAPFYDLYSYWVIPRLGAAVAREPAAYQYLVDSIRRFPPQQEFAHMMERAGFSSVEWENLSFGIACLHRGKRAHAD